MIITANTTAICLYLIAAGLQVLYLMGKRPAPSTPLLVICGTIALCAHAFSAFQGIYQGESLDLSFFKISSLIFCFITAISLLNTVRRPTSTLIAAVFPLSAITIMTSSYAAPYHAIETAIGWGMMTHILSSIVAYSLLTIATIQALTLGFQERHLKHRHIGGILRALPPLQTMEVMLFELIWAGMALLTLSLISGAIFIDDIFAQHLIHKTFFSIAAWLIFAILLWGRHQRGWRSQTAINWTLGGFTALMLAYYGSRFVLEFVLNNQS